MKEKRTIACVVLGVALVSLISVLVTAFANSLVMFVDGNRIYGASVSKDYALTTGGITMGIVALGIAFVTVFFVNKKNPFKVNLGLTIALIVYCIVTSVVLRTLVHDNGSGKLIHEYYSTMTSYITSAITIAVSAALMFGARLYLLKTKQNEPQQTEQGNV